MRNSLYLLILLFSVSLIACKGKNEQASSQPKATATPVAQTKPEKPTIKKAPVTVTPSDERDYPEIVKDLGFPIHPKGEVMNVGNAIIEGDGLFMRLNIEDGLDNLIGYYDKGMVEKGWAKEDLKIFQGADKALRYTKDDVVCRIIMIDEGNYSKVAINMTKKVNPADFEDR